MSQQKLADGLGLTFQQVQKYEKGTNCIGAGRLQQVSHILQVPVAFFFEGAPNVSAPRGFHGSAIIDCPDRQLRRQLRRLTADRRVHANS
jgi:transcriptional regulator with XRE-family HTH domain